MGGGSNVDFKSDARIIWARTKVKHALKLSDEDWDRFLEGEVADPTQPGSEAVPGGGKAMLDYFEGTSEDSAAVFYAMEQMIEEEHYLPTPPPEPEPVRPL